MCCMCMQVKIYSAHCWLARSFDIYPSLSDRHQWLNSRISLRLSFTEPVVKRITSQQHTLANRKNSSVCFIWCLSTRYILIYTHLSKYKDDAASKHTVLCRSTARLDERNKISIFLLASSTLMLLLLLLLSCLEYDFCVFSCAIFCVSSSAVSKVLFIS